MITSQVYTQKISFQTSFCFDSKYTTKVQFIFWKSTVEHVSFGEKKSKTNMTASVQGNKSKHERG